jgi:S-(hydroxymethyl)glutathione dehydrogenase/alcohol dehydrogenase
VSVEARAVLLCPDGGDLRLASVLVSEPLGAEVQVEVRAVGVCHSDLHLVGFPHTGPVIPGHEVAGVVTAVGPDVASVAVGDHVAVTLVAWCGSCAACVSGQSYRCENPGATARPEGAGPRLALADGMAVAAGFGVGGFASYVLVHRNQVVRVPSSLPFEQAALLGCGTLTGVGAVLNGARVEAGESVVVLGCGGVGLSVIQGAVLAGASRIVAVDLNQGAVDAALSVGATAGVCAAGLSPEETVEAIRAAGVVAGAGVPGGEANADGGSAAGGVGLDHAFEVVGLPATTRQAVRSLRVGGRAHLIGLHRPGNLTELDLMLDVIQPQRGIQGIFMGQACVPRDVPRYAELALAGRLDLGRLVGSTVSLGDVPSALAALRSGVVGRTVVTELVA